MRGTQSFVGVMAEVFKRPGLVGLEIAWRWCFWLPLYWVVGIVMGGLGMDVHLIPWAQQLTMLQVALHGGFIWGINWERLAYTGAVYVGIALLWSAFSGVARDLALRRLESRLISKRGTLIALTVLRVLSLASGFAFWVGGLLWLVKVSVMEAFSHGTEPLYVLGFAGLVSLTLVMFVVWCTVSWVLQLAPVMAMGRGLGVGASIAAAWRSGELRSKLVEINLVMGIVKVALVVLALVFSACPLPFSSVETQEFLNWWWFGVFVWWVVASDYFHVVRVAAYVRLWQAFEVRQGVESKE